MNLPSICAYLHLESYQLTQSGFYNCGWFGGSIPAAAITYGTNHIGNNYQWRIPFILQCFACVLVIFFVWFIPESPRWLLAQGRDDEALAFLVKYHGNGDPNARLVRLEIEEMKEGIRIDGIDKRWWDCKFAHFISSSLFDLRISVVAKRTNAVSTRPTIRHLSQRPLAFRPSHHDLRLWTMVRQRSWILQLDYLRCARIHFQLNPTPAELDQLHRLRYRCWYRCLSH